MFYQGFTTLSLKTKLYGLAGFLLLTMTASGLYALSSLASINKELESIAKEDIPLTSALTNITVHQLEQAIWLERSLHHGQNMLGDSKATQKFRHTVEEYQKYSSLVAQEITGALALVNKALTHLEKAESIAEFEHIRVSLVAIVEARKVYGAHVDSFFAELVGGEISLALGSAERITSEVNKIDNELNALLIEISKFTQQAALVAEEHEVHTQNVMYMILGFSLLFGSLITWWVAGDTIRRISYATDVAEMVASGDLVHQVKLSGNDEIGKLLTALELMRGKLLGIISEMQNSSNGLAVASENMSTASNNVSSSIDEQQSELESASSAFNEMNSSMQSIFKSANTAAEASNNVSNTSMEGKHVINDAAESIQKLAQSVEGAGNVILKLEHESESINTVIDVIKSIAEQTNLLALNAAIEAARAGEQGRGFAVVADEVRILAQRTQASTLEIEEMIDRLQSSARDAVQSMDGGRELAKLTVEKTIAAGDAFEEISKSIDSIRDMNSQIAVAAEQQSKVSENINENLMTISKEAQQNTSTMAESSSACEKLAEMAVNLQQVTSRFQAS